MLFPSGVVFASKGCFMACNKPSRAFQILALDEGLSSIVSRAPHHLPPSRYRTLWLPCGTCPGCLADRALTWSIRAYQEAQGHERNSFVTLTYADECLPSDGAISVSEFQRFVKRIRKDLPLRYFACGEYGDITRRPHYHALIFGQDFRSPDDVVVKSDGSYSSALLQKYWPKGHNVVTPLSMATCCYVSGYVQKKQGDVDTFRLSSRRPPIGRPWFDQWGDNARRLGYVVIEGKKLPLPSQFFDWDDSGLFDVRRQERLEYAQSKRSTRSKISEADRAGLAKAKILRARIKMRGELL